jgi:hypothetical protein
MLSICHLSPKLYEFIFYRYEPNQTQEYFPDSIEVRFFPKIVPITSVVEGSYPWRRYAVCHILFPSQEASAWGAVGEGGMVVRTRAFKIA